MQEIIENNTKKLIVNNRYESYDIMSKQRILKPTDRCIIKERLETWVADTRINIHIKILWVLATLIRCAFA